MSARFTREPAIFRHGQCSRDIGPRRAVDSSSILNPRGAPGPSIFGQAPILPHSSITGWISFVMSLSESELVGLPRSDLILSPVDENPNYVGIIRLWKDAGPDLPNAPAV